MSTPALILLGLASALTLHVAGHAQQLVPAPDVVVLHGVVMAEEPAGTPLRGVRVAVTWTGGETEPVFTDDGGRFSVAIRSGVYHTISAAKAGYGPLRIGREPDARDQTVALRMPKGAVITGSVIDAAGAPVSRANVRMRRTDPSGRTYVAGEYQTDTDDRGQFRVGSLPAGRYAVVLDGIGERPVLGNAARPESVVDVPAGVERAVLLIHPSASVSDGSATSYAAGFNAGARAAASAMQTGAETTGLVQGRVIDGFGRPVPGILVRAFAITGGVAPVGASDSSGRYEIGNLPAGTYRLIASRMSTGTNLVSQSAAGGVVVMSMRGLRIPEDGPGQIVVIGPGERLAGVDLTAPGGAVITGQVVDEAGEPLEGITVHAWRQQRAAGRMLLEVGSTVIGGALSTLAGRRTDDRGQYRLFDLPPGSYYIAATETPSEPAATGPSGPLVFHPSAASPAEAVRVTVQEGSEAFATITFASGPLSAVEGEVFDESGEPFGGSVTLVPRARDGTLVAMRRQVQIRDGTFHFADVPPGDYVVQALARTINVLEVVPSRLVPTGGSRAYPTRFGVAFVSATPGAPARTVIQTGTGSVLRGRVVVEGSPGESLPVPISVSAVAADPELSPAGNVRARVQPDGSFEILGLFGPMRFAVDAPAGWRLESVFIEGRNAADEPVTFGSPRQSRADVEVVIARGGAEIAGRISGEAASRAGALVVAGPSDPAGWHERSRFVRMTTADSDGRFTIGGLPAGQFVVAAIAAETVRPGFVEPLPPDDIRFLMPGAAHVSVSAGGRASVEVRVTRLPE